MSSKVIPRGRYRGFVFTRFDSAVAVYYYAVIKRRREEHDRGSWRLAETADAQTFDNSLSAEQWIRRRFDEWFGRWSV